MLISFLWRDSVTNFLKAKKSGKKKIRFDQVFIMFAICLRSKMSTGAYKFMANVFNLTSDQTLCNYDTLDGQSKEGLLHETLRQMENEFGQRETTIECLSILHGDW